MWWHTAQETPSRPSPAYLASSGEPEPSPGPDAVALDAIDLHTELDATAGLGLEELGVRLDDRGALVATPAAQRSAYARHIDALLAPDACKLLITLEYDAEIAEGPPYSITAREIRAYWPELQAVDRYDDIENGPPKFREAGLTEMFETVWR